MVSSPLEAVQRARRNAADRTSKWFIGGSDMSVPEHKSFSRNDKWEQASLGRRGNGLFDKVALGCARPVQASAAQWRTLPESGGELDAIARIPSGSSRSRSARGPWQSPAGKSSRD